MSQPASVPAPAVAPPAVAPPVAAAPAPAVVTGAAKPNGPNGYPADTPLTDMSAEQREAYWKHYARTHEQTAKDRGDYDAVKAENERLRALTLTTEQKAIEDAKTEGRQAGLAEASQKFGAQLVAAEFRGLLGGRLNKADGTVDADRLAALVAGLNPAAYLADDGSVKTDALKAWADAVAPAGPVAPVVPGKPAGQQWPAITPTGAPREPGSTTPTGGTVEERAKALLAGLNIPGIPK